MPENVENRSMSGLLAEFRQGNREAADELMRQLYPELRRLAVAKMKRERPDHTWEPTALVNELYLELAKAKRLDSGAYRNDRNAFFAFAAHMMNRLLVYHARPLYRRMEKIAIDTSTPGTLAAEDLNRVETLLASLEAIDAQLRTILEMRVFEGRTMEEIATELGCSARTLERRWQFIRHWLKKELA
jgi:RNA polymerase sigma factor (TIGR02999 family)